MVKWLIGSLVNWVIWLNGSLVNSPKGFPLHSKFIGYWLLVIGYWLLDIYLPIRQLGMLALRPCHAVADDMKSEMSVYRLPADKHVGILT